MAGFEEWDDQLQAEGLNPDAETIEDSFAEAWEKSIDDLIAVGDWQSVKEVVGDSPEACTFLVAKRRDIVLSLRERGFSHRAIAELLNESVAVVHSDLTYMHKRSRQTARPLNEEPQEQEYVEEHRDYEEEPATLAEPIAEVELEDGMQQWFARFAGRLARIIRYLRSQ